VEFQHHALRKITVSAGVAMFPQNGATAKALLSAADDAVYVAKRTGRNRVVVAPAEQATAGVAVGRGHTAQQM
jgi:diguanylate cyclase (GGDEF)-like protein